MVTLKDIAEEAGVSVITVSRVMNDKHRGKVSSATRAKIMRIAKKRGYQPNVSARALRGTRTYQFGLVIPQIDGSFTPEIVQGLQEVAMESWYSCLLYVTDFRPEVELKIFETLRRKGADGVLWLPGPTWDERLLTYIDKMPTVQLLHKEMPDQPALLVDQEEGGYMAAQHLIELGHRRIAKLTVRDRHGVQRLEGFYEALADAGMDARPEWVRETTLDWEDARAVATELLTGPERPTAIVCYSDTVAWGALRAAHHLGIKVPEQLSIIGYDDIPFTEYIETPMTTVAQPKNELGKEAMRLLIRAIEEDTRDDHLLTPNLVVRSSTAPFSG